MLRKFTHLILLSSISLSSLSIHAENRASGLKEQADTARVMIDVYEYNSVDVQPRFPGGDAEMFHFINTERRYPNKAYHDGIEGRVLCSFIVNEDGTISHVSVIKSVEPSLDREAVRILSKMPAWDAGKVKETPVPVYCILPVAFRK